MKGTTFASEEVKRAMAAYVPVKIDVDRHAAIAVNYGAHSIPTMVVLDPAGNEKERSVGYLSPEDMVKWLGQRGPTTQPATRPQ
jgi:thiol:disulfide interchange protein